MLDVSLGSSSFAISLLKVFIIVMPLITILKRMSKLIRQCIVKAQVMRLSDFSKVFKWHVMLRT